MSSSQSNILFTVSVSWSCCNKGTQTWWLKITEIYCLAVLEVRVKIWQGHASSGGSRRESVPYLFQLLVPVDFLVFLWPVTMSPHFCLGLNSASPQCVSSLGIHPSLAVVLAIKFQAHPDNLGWSHHNNYTQEVSFSKKRNTYSLKNKDVGISLGRGTIHPVTLYV